MVAIDASDGIWMDRNQGDDHAIDCPRIEETSVPATAPDGSDVENAGGHKNPTGAHRIHGSIKHTLVSSRPSPRDLGSSSDSSAFNWSNWPVSCIGIANGDECVS